MCYNLINLNGFAQGTLLTERELEADHKQWPSQLWIAVDMYGENQRIAILPDSSRIIGVSTPGTTGLGQPSDHHAFACKRLVLSSVH